MIIHQWSGDEAIRSLGKFSLFVWRCLAASPNLWRRRQSVLDHVEQVGFASLPVVIGAAMCLGAALSYQLFFAFSRLGSEGWIGATVGKTLFREIAPVMGSIMVAGRAGAAIAAELASMRVSQQTDALQVMGVNLCELLAMPRVWAGFFSVPILCLVFAIVGSVTGALVACFVLGLQWPIYWSSYVYYLDVYEIIHCSIKAACFGIALTVTSCYCGLNAQGGSKGVGQATRNSVVMSCLVILFCDFILTSTLPVGFRTLRMM